jgi:hypothetical protein
MTPLFAVPDSGSGEPEIVPVPRRRGPARPARRASGSGGPDGAVSGRGRRTTAGSRLDAGDLVAVTAERLQRALARSFLRYGVPGDPEAAVHAAMNVIEPVLQARDTEILRLRGLMTGKRPGR